MHTKIAIIGDLVDNNVEHIPLWPYHSKLLATALFKKLHATASVLVKPLQARYCGPYVIDKRLNEVDDVVFMPDCHKQRWVSHINMIKEYHDSSSSPLVVPVANMVALKGESGMEEEPMGADVKLKNSNV